MRIKSHWYKDAKPRSMAQHASAMAFIIWRVALNALNRMRKQQYEIDAGPQYFAFMTEFLIFLIQIADRIAYRRLDADQRNAFTTALAVRVGEILEDNKNDLLGAQAEHGYKSQFIALLNQRAEDYAAFGYGDAGPEFGFLRYLGNQVMDLMPARDKIWVVAQVMEIEAPEAVETVQSGMRGLFEPAGRARPSRSGLGGE